MLTTLPTVDEFLTRFPVFNGQDDLIEQLIPEAAYFVEDNWVQPLLAAMYYVAHSIVSEGSADSYPVTSESLGPISTSYAVDLKADPLSTTEYGRRYLRLKKLSSLIGTNPDGGDAILVAGGD